MAMTSRNSFPKLRAMTNKTLVVQRLFEIGAIRFDGPFTLKSGIESPFYVDLRLLVSDPQLLTDIAHLFHQLILADVSTPFSHLCGVPYTALPMATALSVLHGLPMLMRRKERKAYGTKRVIEGLFSKGDTVLVLEDLVTSGLSVFETIEPLREEGLLVQDVVVLLDRQQGARANIERRGVGLHALVTMEEVLSILGEAGLITSEKRKEVETFITENQVSISECVDSPVSSRQVIKSFAQRSEIAVNKVAKNLFALMERKQTNLCVSADLPDKADLLALVKAVGPHVCCIKTHIDIVRDVDQTFLSALSQLAQELDFVLFEDRKFADIGNTVGMQYSSIVGWAHLTNAHPLPGPGIVRGLEQEASAKGLILDRGVLLLAEMSSSDNLFTPEYTEACVRLAELNKGFVSGFICQNAVGLKKQDGFLYMSPGVKVAAEGDGLGQQYRTPETAICEQGNDIVIVGRGVYHSADPAATALLYKQQAWKAYVRTLQS